MMLSHDIDRAMLMLSNMSRVSLKRCVYLPQRRDKWVLLLAEVVLCAPSTLDCSNVPYNAVLLCRAKLYCRLLAVNCTLHDPTHPVFLPQCNPFLLQNNAVLLMVLAVSRAEVHCTLLRLSACPLHLHSSSTSCRGWTSGKRYATARSSRPSCGR